jgi:hypothetical protein
MARATLVLGEKVIDESGNILELALWRVPVSDRYREGVRYRLAYIEHGENAPSVLYDNHAPKGHHRHVRGVERPYDFSGIDQLLTDFKADVARTKEDK